MSRKYFLIAAIAFSGAVYGYNIGVIAGVLIFMHSSYSHVYIALFASSFFWGITSVILFVGVLSDRFGRRTMLRLAPIITIVAAIYMTFTDDAVGMVVARYFLGVASAIISVNVPTYLSEIVSPHIRGRAIAGFQLSLCSGLFLATFITLFYVNSTHWQWVFLYGVIPALILLLASCMMPESPRWLVLNKHYERAKAALMKFSSPSDTEIQYKSIVNGSIDFSRAGFLKIISTHRNYIWPTFLAIMIGVLNNLIGINAFLQYDAIILLHAGFVQHGFALSGTLVIVAINLFSTVIAMMYVDKFERKNILFVSLLGILFSLISLSAVSLLMATSVLKGFVTLILLLVFIISFALGPGALIWIITSEILPSKIRARALSIAQCCSSLASALLISVFLPLEKHIGYSSIFMICAIFCLMYVLISFSLPKTKGKTLEEIEMLKR